MRSNLFRTRIAVSALLAAGLATSAFVTVTVVGGPKHASQHWGVITRNAVGSPVAILRDGPYGSFGVVGSSGEPPLGKGSLGIHVAAGEKVDFGNEVDFFGDSAEELTAVGFQVFQAGENTAPAAGGPGNMPVIRFEIDPNLGALPTTNYSTMVWVPAPAPVVNMWSPYLDATTTGAWFFTGLTGTATSCNLTTPCSFAAAIAALSDGGAAATIYTVSVGKGTDNRWSGAVDALRINDRIYDFEVDGVKQKAAN